MFRHGDRPLDDYTIQRGVGRGGFGEVYYAISDGGREVALKYLRENPDVELRGVSHCINLKSPHLVTIFDVKRNADGEYFIIMEYVGGPSLRDLLIAEPNGLGVEKAAFFMRELAKGMGYLHDRGIVHRDLKPGNIFYDDGYVKIGDYGLSKFISVSRHSAQTSSVGTVHYMAPEVGSGNYSRTIDIYALGVMLYEMLLGKVPFEGGTLGEVLMKHLTVQPEVDELPEPFAGVIRRALAKDPNERYQTVDEMVQDIFGAGDVEDSLIGFDPASLTQVAARGAQDLAASPVPSPNPPGPVHFGAPPVAPARLDRRLQKISDKIQRKMDALDRKAGKVPRRMASIPLESGERLRRVVISAMVGLGIAMGAGVLLGAPTGKLELGISAFLLTVGMAGGLLLAQRVIAWTGSAAQPEWVQRLLMGACCGPLMFIGAAPVLLAERPNIGFAALVGLASTFLLVDWKKRVHSGAAGELRIGTAFGAAFCAWIVAVIVGNAIVRRGPGEGAWLAAMVAGCSSLILQAVSWFLPVLGGEQRNPGAGRSLLVSLRRRGRHREPPGTPAPVHRREEIPSPPPPPTIPGLDSEAPPHGIPVEGGTRWARWASNEPLPPERWMVTRAFWTIVAFCLFGGMVIGFLCALLLEWPTRPDGSPVADAFNPIFGCIACGSFMIFALRKTTQRRRRGFWRETLRPVLIAASMTGVGTAIAALGFFPYESEELVAVITVLVLSALILLISVFATGRSSPRCVLLDTPPLRAIRVDGDESKPLEPETTPGGTAKTADISGVNPAE